MPLLLTIMTLANVTHSTMDDNLLNQVMDRKVQIDKQKEISMSEEQPKEYLSIELASYSKAEEKEQSQKRKSDWMTVEATAYTSECEGCTGITFTGKDVRDTIYHDGLRIIAVDPSVIPLYSIVEIDTGNRLIIAIALDIGGAIKGNKIDLLVEDKLTAKQWGRRNVHLRILEYGS